MAIEISKRPGIVARVYDLITGEEDARVCRDIPEDACDQQPGNFVKFLVSNTLTKVGDGLADAKLVIPWILTSLGAPAFMTGLTVPIREAGALLPQLFIAAFIRPFKVRKWFWSGGSIVEGIAILAMALVTATLVGATAGWIILGLLVVFSLSRGVASVSAKDVKGKTVSKGRRGVLSGYAALGAGIVTVAVGLYAKVLQKGELGDEFFYFVLVIAGILWILAALVFATLRESPGATEGGGNAFRQAFESTRLLVEDKQFRHFVITRALLLSTALSLPYYAALANENTGASASGLGLMFVASGLGGTISAPIWGKLSDRSSRLVIVGAAAMTFVLGVAITLLYLLDGELMQTDYTYAAFFLFMGIAHGGARLGRKTYLVDMATPETRAAYVALSNTAIGILLLAGSAFGIIASAFGTIYALASLAVIALIAATSGLKLSEVED